jgi:putative transposase
MVKKKKLTSGNSCVYEIYYHLVWCPKYRKPILTKEIKDWLKKAIPIICETKEWKLHEIEVMPDHIHLFISSHPKDSPTGIIKILKGVTGLRLFKEFPQLKKEYWGGHIWSSSYYIGTVGSVTKDAIRKYIAENSSNQ